MIGYAKKIGMTRLFIDGTSVAVTSVKVPESTVVQIKTQDNDGYCATQLGSYKKKNLSKPLKGHVKKNLGKEVAFGVLAEFKDFTPDNNKSSFSIQDFSEGDVLSVTSFTKGLGFTGVIKRWRFRGQPKSHGHDHQRAVGSIGDGGSQRVFPGTKMAGRKGLDKKTLNNVKIVAIDHQNSLLFLSGSIPGSNNSIMKIKKV